MSIYVTYTTPDGSAKGRTTDKVLVQNLKVTGPMGEVDVLGLVSVTSEHVKDKDHGWVIRNALLINGVPLKVQTIKSNEHKQYGSILSDGEAPVGPVKTTIHKALWKQGIQTTGEET